MSQRSLSQNDLPDFSHIRAGIRRGRNIRDGYARGWGLQFGELRDLIATDDLFLEASALARGRSIQSIDNRMNLYLLLRLYVGSLEKGHVVEYGAYKGGSAIFMARVCQVLHPGMSVYAFDTFTGMPEADESIDAHRAGDFADVDLAELVDYKDGVGLDNLHFVPGTFERSVPATLAAIGHVRLSHIDSDLYSAVAFAYETTVPHMVPGGYVVFDDSQYSSCLGATEVVEDLVVRRDGRLSEQVFPQHVFRVGLSDT